MDADISAAADSLSLAKISAQDLRAYRAAMVQQTQAINAQAAALPPEPTAEVIFRRDMALAIAPKFTAQFVISGGTDPNVLAAQIKAALDAVVAVV